MITCSSSSYNAVETLSTLRFGARAKCIRNKPKANQERSAEEYQRLLTAADKREAELRKYVAALEAEIQSLRGPLVQEETGDEGGLGVGSDDAALSKDDTAADGAAIDDIAGRAATAAGTPSKTDDNAPAGKSITPNSGRARSPSIKAAIASSESALLTSFIELLREAGDGAHEPLSSDNGLAAAQEGASGASVLRALRLFVERNEVTLNEVKDTRDEVQSELAVLQEKYREKCFEAEGLLAGFNASRSQLTLLEKRNSELGAVQGGVEGDGDEAATAAGVAAGAATVEPDDVRVSVGARPKSPVRHNRLSSMSDRNSFGGLSEADTSGSEDGDEAGESGDEVRAEGENDVDASILSDGDETIMDAREQSRTLSFGSQSSDEGSDGSDGSEDEGMEAFTRVIEESPCDEESDDEEADGDIKKLQKWLTDEPSATEREAELVREFDKQLKVMKKLRAQADNSSAEKAMLAELMENMDEEGGKSRKDGASKLQKLIRDATVIKRSLDDARREQHRLLAQSQIHSMNNKREKRDQKQVNEAMECVVAELQDSLRIMSEQQQEMRRKEKQQDDHIKMLYQTLTDVNQQHAAAYADHQGTIAALNEEIARYKSVFSTVNSITEASGSGGDGKKAHTRSSLSEPRRLGSATISKPKPIRGKGVRSESPRGSPANIAGRGSFDLDGNPVKGPSSPKSQSPKSPTREATMGEEVRCARCALVRAIAQRTHLTSAPLTHSTPPDLRSPLPPHSPQPPRTR